MILSHVVYPIINSFYDNIMSVISFSTHAYVFWVTLPVPVVEDQVVVIMVVFLLQLGALLCLLT